MKTPEFYFHTQYNGKEYAKLSVKTDNGVFTIIVNKMTGNIRCQVYTNKKTAKTVYCGTNAKGLYKGFKALAAKWNVIDDKDKGFLRTCWERWEHSLDLFIEKRIKARTLTYGQHEELLHWACPFRGLTLDDVVRKTQGANACKIDIGTLAKSVNDAVKCWEAVIGARRTRIMLKNSVVNAIEYYDRDKDGEIANHLLYKIAEVMSRKEK